MPDRDVETIQDLIYYQYAKIIAKCCRRVLEKINQKRRYLHTKNG
jgi:hypothetical protein